MALKRLNIVKSSEVMDRREFLLSNEYIDISVLADLLIDILSYVPYRDLLYSCRLVCKHWKETIDGHSVWKRKCERAKFNTTKCKLEKIPDNYHKYKYLHGISKENLLKNPCGEEKKFTPDWKIFQRGDGFKVETPPKGADVVPLEVGFQSCFATSYSVCRKHQEIDLYKNKINQYLLKKNVVKMRIGDWYSAHYHSGCKYELLILLLDCVRNEVEKFYYQTTEEKGKTWCLVTHEFTHVSKVRYVHFEHSGRSDKLWHGHFGCKMTGSYVELCLK